MKPPQEMMNDPADAKQSERSPVAEVSHARWLAAGFRALQEAAGRAGAPPSSEETAARAEDLAALVRAALRDGTALQHARGLLRVLVVSSRAPLAIERHLAAVLDVTKGS